MTQLREDEEVSRGRLTLAAVFARLLPPGVGPGAVQAGAVEYVDQLLAHGWPGLRFLLAGLGSLERMALERHGVSFAALDPSRQDDVLRELQGRPQGEGLLRQLVLLALEGSFCHPARGGNLNGVGWRFAGLDTAAVHPLRCRAS
jgi:gluconate 2-dehydrogenase gamma chain